MGQSNIDWTEHSWNVVTGCLMPVDCAVRDHCYASAIAHRLAGRFGYPEDNPMVPTFHEDRLNEPSKRKKPTIYFVCSMGDLFGENISSEWIERVLEVTREHPEHLYLFLTKNPQRYKEFEGEFGHTVGLGTTVNKDVDLLIRVKHLMEVNAPLFRFISFEPLYEDMKSINQFMDYDYIDQVHSLSKIKLFIIGAQTRPNIQPDCSWVHNLINSAEVYGIHVFVKDNLKAITRRQEFPYLYCRRIDDWIPTRKCNPVQCILLDCEKKKEVEKSCEICNRQETCAGNESGTFPCPDYRE